ncbi:MAG: WxcM-like domain-containing protein [Anaerolineae bacterium]|nr:WxcM-like domain-containing protein [Anaerolineae bacterium]
MTHEIIKPSFVRVDERGDFRELLNEGQWESLVYGAMKQGAVLGNHYHKNTKIFFFLLSGKVTISTENVETGEKEKFELSTSEGCYFFPHESHKLIFEEDGSFVFLKDKQYSPQEPDTYPYPVNF